MGAAGHAIDEITDKLVEAAGYMLVPAYVFPPVKGIEMLMPVGKGGPGTLAEGARSWLDAADALHSALTQLDSVCAGLGPDAWNGDDRTAFDATVRQLHDQLDTSGTFARGVGATLAALAVPLSAYGGVCVGIGGVLLSEAVAYWSAVASIVGNLGPSEALLAAGTATAATCLAVLAGVVGGYAVLMETAAAGLTIGSLADAHQQQREGDTDAVSTYRQAQVDGLGEVAENLEAFAADVAIDQVTQRVTHGVPDVSVEDKIIKHAIEGELSGRLGDVNSAGVDVVKGDPVQALEDLSGHGDQIDQLEDLLGDDDPPPPDRTHYDLPPAPPTPPSPPSPPVHPIPPAEPGGPHVVPLPPADGDDPQIVPTGAQINDGVRPA